ncbi:MAG: helix-turn-helix domain-containing protein [Candidatus Limnocylindrales bacterium]
MATIRRTGGDDELLEVRRAAAPVGRHPETVRRWVWSGRLAARCSGHRLLVARADIEALVRHNHPVYDMVYVALAQRRGVQLVTADAALRAVVAGFDGVVAPEQAVG